jgi:hypothetical protein
VTYFYDRFEFEPGSRITGIWMWPWRGDPGADLVALVSHVRLGPGQDGSLESDFLSSHLPWAFGGFHGVGPDGDPWLVVVQVAPRSAAADVVGSANQWWPLTDGVERALRLNPDAGLIDSEGLTVDDLRGVYDAEGIPADQIDDWPAGDLLAGLLAECANVHLAAVVSGRVTGCAFPDELHDCEHDVFRDVFAGWAQGRIPTPQEGRWEDEDGCGEDESDEDEDEDEDEEFGEPPAVRRVIRTRLVFLAWKRRRVRRWSTTRVRLQAVEDGWTAKAARKASRKELVEYLTTPHKLRMTRIIRERPLPPPAASARALEERDDR